MVLQWFRCRELAHPGDDDGAMLFRVQVSRRTHRGELMLSEGSTQFAPKQRQRRLVISYILTSKIQFSISGKPEDNDNDDELCKCYHTQRNAMRMHLTSCSLSGCCCAALHTKAYAVIYAPYNLQYLL